MNLLIDVDTPEVTRGTPFFSFDTRALGVFRIALGLCCIADILRRLPYLDLLYTNKGVLSNHFVLFSEQQRVFSLLYAFSSYWEVLAFFIFTLLTACFFTIGYRTKPSLVITLLGMVSIVNRNSILIYGGDTVLINCLFLSLFFPLSEQFSVDSRRSLTPPRTFTSVATALFFIQLAGIYLFASLHKTGDSWGSGLGLYYSLHHSRLTSVIGYWFGQNLPISILKLLSDLALWAEFLGSLLILCPLKSNILRPLAFLMLATFHISSALFFNIGLFPYVMIAHLIPLLPSGVMSRVFTKDPHEKVSQIPDRIPAYCIFRECAAIAFGVFMVLSFISSNWIIRQNIRNTVPNWVGALAHYTSFRESWSMFGPEAPHTDYYLTFEATLDNNETIDVVTGKPPLSGVSHPGQQYWDQHLDAMTGILLPDRGIQMIEVVRWITERQGGMKIPPGRVITRFAIKRYTWKTPLPNVNRLKIEPTVENLLLLDQTKIGNELR